MLLLYNIINHMEIYFWLLKLKLVEEMVVQETDSTLISLALVEIMVIQYSRKLPTWKTQKILCFSVSGFLISLKHRGRVQGHSLLLTSCLILHSHFTILNCKKISGTMSIFLIFLVVNENQASGLSIMLYLDLPVLLPVSVINM